MCLLLVIAALCLCIRQPTHTQYLTTILGKCLCSPAPYIADGRMAQVLSNPPSKHLRVNMNMSCHVVKWAACTFQLIQNNNITINLDLLRTFLLMLKMQILTALRLQHSTFCNYPCSSPMGRGGGYSDLIGQGLPLKTPILSHVSRKWNPFWRIFFLKS